MSRVPIQFVEGCGVGPSTRAPGMAQWLMHTVPAKVPGKVITGVDETTGMPVLEDAVVDGVAEAPASLAYVCPCGCASFQVVHVVDLPGHTTNPWDGNAAAPTLRLPIAGTACQWRGRLVAGVFVEA